MRNRYSLAFTDVDSDSILISPIVPFSYRELSDNILHVATKGEMLWDLAEKYYSKKGDSSLGLNDAWSYYDIIADFQPNPIADPTLSMIGGENIYLPSIQTIKMLIENENRRQDFVTY